MTFSEIIEENYGLLVDRLNKTYIEGMDRDDIMQELLLISYRVFINFNNEKGAKFSTYLYKALSREIYYLIQSMKESKDVFNNNILSLDAYVKNTYNEVSFIELEQSDEDIINSVLKEELIKDIFKIIKEDLTEREKEVLNKRVFLDMTYKEIASTYKVSINAVRDSYIKAINKIKRKIL